MAFELKLSAPWKSQRWKVKIRDKERGEEPHVTILRGTKAWRISLRTQKFLDKEPEAKEVPNEIVEEVVKHIDDLTVAWDKMYPYNPVTPEPDDE